jgi:hypothetical protein
LRLLEDPALDARDAHPAWLPAMMPWCSSPGCRSAAGCHRLRVLAHPGHKQLLHDGKGWR